MFDQIKTQQSNYIRFKQIKEEEHILLRHTF